MMNDLQKRIEDRLAAEVEAGQVKCPLCCHVFDCDDMEGLTTFHGEKGPQTHECPGCEVMLMVEEYVTRTFTVTVKDDE